MPNYDDVFVSELFLLPTDSSKVSLYIGPNSLQKKQSFCRKDGRIEAYQSSVGMYKLPEECTEKGMTIVGECVINAIGERHTVYSFAPGKNPKKEDLKLLISLRKKTKKNFY